MTGQIRKKQPLAHGPWVLYSMHCRSIKLRFGNEAFLSPKPMSQMLTPLETWPGPLGECGPMNVPRVPITSATPLTVKSSQYWNRESLSVSPEWRRVTSILRTVAFTIFPVQGTAISIVKMPLYGINVTPRRQRTRGERSVNIWSSSQGNTFAPSLYKSQKPLLPHVWSQGLTVVWGERGHLMSIFSKITYLVWHTNIMCLQ